MTTSNEHNNAPAVPQGWKLVPIEPTQEMIRCAEMWDEGFEGAYARALAATPAPAPAAGILDRARWGGQVVNLMRLAEAADKAVASMTVPAPEAGSESKIVIDVGPGGSGGGPAEAAPPATEQTAPAPAPAQERCSTCGYLTSEREHLGCLRRAVKDLDIATGGPYDAQEVGLTDELIKKAAGTPEGYKFAAKGISKIDVWPHGGNWFPLYSLAQVQSIIAALRAKGGK